MVYLKYLIGLIFGLLLVLLALRPWLKKRGTEGWEDVKLVAEEEKEKEAEQELKKQNARLQTEYSKYQKWLTTFCKSWNEVTQKAQQAAQFQGSQDEYIQTLEAKSGIKLYRCIPEWGEKPDPIFISQNIPENTSIFQNTIAFMKTQTDNIKANTKDAMNINIDITSSMKEEKISGFADFQPNCTLGTDTLTCIFPLGPNGSILPVDLTPKALADKLETLNNELVEFNTPLQEVHANLAEADNIARRAESGTLFK